MPSRRLIALASLCCTVLAGAGCSHRDPKLLAEASGSSAPSEHGARRATANLVPLNNSGISGTLVLTEVLDGGVKVEGQIHGLKPEGLHGFHVHDRGDCSAVDGSSAGGHFNPTDKPHGDPAAAASHLGDLGNIQANNAGIAEVFVVKKGATLAPGNNSFVGRGLIVHRDSDDMATQPAGASGDRLGCAVIRLSH